MVSSERNEVRGGAGFSFSYLKFVKSGMQLKAYEKPFVSWEYPFNQGHHLCF
jgi:hypothetical protein